MNAITAPRQQSHRLDAEALWENVFAPHRTRILYPLSVTGAVVFLPLAAVHFLQSHLGLGMVLVAMVLMLAADAIALHRGAPPPVPFALLLLPGFAGVAMSLATLGVGATFWSYPLVFLTFFVLRRRVANTVSLLLVAGCALLTALSHEPGIAVRYVLSLSFCLMVINIMLNVLESLHTRLLEQSLTDPLTGAFNRRHMDATLDEVIERHGRTSAAASALLIDIDHFKRINDRLGHDAGDEVLRKVVAVIHKRRRKLDLLFRQGGEEFLLLLPDTRKTEAMVVAEKLRQAVENKQILDRGAVTVSIGVGELREGDDAAEWLKRLDEALYLAKETGRNRVMSDALRPIGSRATPVVEQRTAA